MLLPCSLIGTVSNILNICAFSRSGLQDSVTITFFALSISDLSISLSLLTICICAALSASDNKESSYYMVDTLSLMRIVGMMLEPFIQMSIMFTCYLALTRSMCVVLPFKFKQIFTPRRSVFTLSLFSCLSLGYLTVFTEVEMKCVEQTGNFSQIALVYLDYYETANLVSDTLRGPVVTFVSEIMVLVCAFLMVNKLKKSMQFHNKQSILRKTVQTTCCSYVCLGIIESSSRTKADSTIIDNVEKVTKIGSLSSPPNTDIKNVSQGPSHSRNSSVSMLTAINASSPQDQETHDIGTLCV